MRIGVYKPTTMPLSISGYYRNVAKRLADTFGVDFFEFHAPNLLDRRVDLIWDPRAGRGAPPIWLKRFGVPVIATYHGAVPLVLPIRESVGRDITSLWKGWRERRRIINGWTTLSGSLAAVITVSEYAKQEFISAFGFDGERVHPVHHGVDQHIFLSSEELRWEGAYFLHVSQYAPKKNVERMLHAYSRAAMPDKPPLVLICPDFPTARKPPHVAVIRTAKSPVELARYYQNARAFVFPSLHETFGMPVLEAMASGCPVITSNNTALKEIVGDSALLVDPRSTSEISAALVRVHQDRPLREGCVERGILRAANFTWRRSSEEHFRVFSAIRNAHYNRLFWDIRYRECPELGSGPGSRGLNRWYKGELLRSVIKSQGARSVIDIGCGDLAVWEDVPPILDTYVGVDVSETVLEENKRRTLAFCRTAEFVHHDIVSGPVPRSADMVVCLDVLIHQLGREQFSRALDSLLAHDVPWIVVSYQEESETDRAVDDQGIGEGDPPREVREEHARFRELNGELKDIERGQIAVHGNLKRAISERCPSASVLALGAYRGQTVYLIEARPSAVR